jgi:hypothetical protein
MHTGSLPAPLERWLNRLGECVGALEKLHISEYTCCNPAVAQRIRELQKLAGQKLHDRHLRHPGVLRQFVTLAARARRVFEAWEVALERHAAHQLLYTASDASLKTRLTQQPKLNETFEFAGKEGKTLGLNAHSRVVFVGSGPFHESALCLALQFGCAVTCIDNNAAAITNSKHLNAHMGMEHNIAFIHEDARLCDYRGYTHAVVAVLARPKSAILERIRATNPTMLVAVRTVEGAHALLYEPLDPEQLAGWEIMQVVRPNNLFEPLRSLVVRAVCP